MTEWLVIATAFDGKERTLARYSGREAAEDYPVRMADWKSVRIVAVGEKPELPYKRLRLPRRSELAFAQLVAVALAGGRCPPTGTGYFTWNAKQTLVRSGRIKIEVYAKNWRVVTILAGPHAGKHTAMPPGRGGVPYMVFQASV